MKCFLWLVAFTACIYEISSNCVPVCKDQLRNCALLRLWSPTFCTTPLTRAFCLRTCGDCFPCTAEVKCEDCVDQNPTRCTLLKHLNQCSSYRDSCKLSCGNCTVCAPTQVPPRICEVDCENSNPSCDEWQAIGYCNDTRYKVYMENICKRACNVCTVCPTRAARLPPVAPTECSLKCEDNHDSCEYWAGKGYCNASLYSDILTACPFSCETCIPCVTTSRLPPPAPEEEEEPEVVECSKDCEDRNEECEFWETQNYCSPESEHYETMRIECRVSCGFCTPCEDRAAQIQLVQARKSRR